MNSKSLKVFFSIGMILAIGALFWQCRLFQKVNQKSFDLKVVAVDFDISMQKEKNAVLLKGRSDFMHVYDFFKSIYEKNNLNNVTAQQSAKIPKIIHIMWLGARLPDEYRSYVKSWSLYHPTWTILFWTDNPVNYDQGTLVVHSFTDLEKLFLAHPEFISGDHGEHIVVDTRQLEFDNRGFYDAAKNYGEKSDILKWEIVYRFGGVYVDTDFECYRALDVFHHTYDFYTGIQPLDTNMVQLGAALYGAIPHHPILEACVKGIKSNQHIQQIIMKTGPIHFTKMFLAVAGKSGLLDIAMPASYFYPCNYEQKGTGKNVWCKAESYAVHHWAGSWLKPEAFVRS